MNRDDEQGRRIARLLDDSVQHLTAEQQAKLANARELALSRYRVQRQPALQPAWAGSLNRLTERSVFGVRYVIPVAALVLGLMGVAYVHNGGVSPDIADIDAAILSDELPISAYLDKGFDAWPIRSSR